MSLQESNSAAPANRRADTSVANSSKNLHPTFVSGPPDNDGDRWFADIAQEFYPKPQKPGAALRSLTGYEERNCQRYASAAVQPAGHFIRQLLRSDHGAQWLDALMVGCTAPWWLDRQRDARLAAASKRFVAEITERD